jgi:hypothetical protein
VKPVAILSALVLSTACAAPAPPPLLENHATAPPAPATTASDELVAMLLSEFLADPSSMPDGGMVEHGDPIPVVVEVTNGPPPSADRLPRGKRRFELTTVQALQARAEATKTRIGYLHIAIVIDSATSASVDHGGDFVAPADPSAVKLCCCSTSRHYDRKPAGWTVRSGVVVTSCG